MFAKLTNLLPKNNPFAIGAGAAAIGLSSLFLIRQWAKGGKCPKDYFNKDLSNKVIVITGGNTGIGFETAKQLGSQGAHIIIGCRSKERAEQAIQSMKKANPKINIEYLNLDLSDLKSVENFVKEFKAKNLPIHMLINNAGIMWTPHGTTKQGVEIQFGTNHLGHFYLTLLLLDDLKKNDARVINVSSLAHTMGNRTINFDNLLSDCKGVSPQDLYAQSKLANILFTYKLEKLFREDKNTKATANCLHPGVVRTELGRHIPFIARTLMGLFYPIYWSFTKSPFEGAQTTLYAALSPNLEGGLYLSDCKPIKSIPESYNEELQDKLWKYSEDLVKTLLK